MQEYVEYYMQLTDYVMEEPEMHERHDELCRLLVQIADDYPDSVAPNRGKVLSFPKARVLNPRDPYYGEEKELEFEMFVAMFTFNEDFEESTGLKGDDVYFLTLSLWYEVCKLRDKLKLKGRKIYRFEKEVDAAIEEARKRKQQQEKLLEKQQRESLFQILPHFNVKKSDEELLAILKGFKEVEWRYNRVKYVGFVDEDVTDDEWLSALKGPSDTREMVTRKIPFKAKYVCKSFVAQYLDSDYKLAEKVFCLSGGKDINGLENTNIYRKDDICDRKEGKIAVILRAARR